MAKHWVIGDVHGCCKTLRALIEEKLIPGREDKLIFVGDYIDRGPDSKGVITYLMELQLLGYSIILLKGNHEDMMLRAAEDKSARNNWFYNGGMPTLNSFGVRDVQEIPSHFMEFLLNLDYYYLTEQFVVVHAGLNFNLDDPFSDKEAMLWIRNQKVVPEKIGNRKLIHGHTPIMLDKLVESVESNAPNIDLDNGCVYVGTPGLGNLCALELSSMRLEVQPNKDIIWP
ncbi:MAG: serine/threonine protein phosphatase [Chitinophagales bacterium]|nr:MAG: serine/threonine protein phosphatase [Chitinophagales bacterium]